ncbi:unnamed protein product [Cunninghamella blakesleeana]
MVDVAPHNLTVNVLSPNQCAPPKPKPPPPPPPPPGDDKPAPLVQGQPTWCQPRQVAAKGDEIPGPECTIMQKTLAY